MLPFRSAKRWNCAFLHALTLFLAYYPICHAILVNRTIDDSDIGDPTTHLIPIYNPQIWNRNRAPCIGCTINPDPKLAFDGTTSSTTYIPNGGYTSANITLKFTGVAIWVFFILANANPDNPFTSTYCNFTLDGQYAGSFSHDADLSTTALQYNATVFSKTGLSNTPHQLVISVNDYPNITYLCFDWALYSFDEGTIPSNAATPSAIPAASKTPGLGSPSGPTPQKRTGTIVGGALGGLAVIVTAFLCLLCWRRYRQQTEISPPTPTMFSYTSPDGSVPNRPTNGALPPLSHDHWSSSALEKGRTPKSNGSQWPTPRDINRRIPDRNPPLSTGSNVSTHASQDIVSLHDQMYELRSRIEALHDRLPAPHEGAPPAYT